MISFPSYRILVGRKISGVSISYSAMVVKLYGLAIFLLSCVVVLWLLIFLSRFRSRGAFVCFGWGDRAGAKSLLCVTDRKNKKEGRFQSERVVRVSGRGCDGHRFIYSSLAFSWTLPPCCFFLLVCAAGLESCRAP
jgi:hypothetical protein